MIDEMLTIGRVCHSVRNLKIEAIIHLNTAKGRDEPPKGRAQLWQASPLRLRYPKKVRPQNRKDPTLWTPFYPEFQMDRSKGATPVLRYPVRCDRRGVDKEMTGILSLWHRMQAVGGRFVLVLLEGQNPVKTI